MKTFAKLAFPASLLLVLSACGEAEEPAEVETEITMPADETVPLDATVEDPMATDPMAEGTAPAEDAAMDPAADPAVPAE